jgi:hypothetical protein
MLKNQYASMQAPEQNHVRGALAHWLVTDCPDPAMPHFLKNKVIIIIINMLIPVQQNSFTNLRVQLVLHDRGMIIIINNLMNFA